MTDHPPRDLDSMPWQKWHELAKRALMNRVMAKMDMQFDTYSPISEVMRLHFRLASLSELLETLSNLMATEHRFIPEFQLLCNRSADQLYFVVCKHQTGGGDFREVFRKHFLDRDSQYFNQEQWDEMNVALKGSCSAVAFRFSSPQSGQPGQNRWNSILPPLGCGTNQLWLNFS